jgi:hypothetical protein
MLIGPANVLFPASVSVDPPLFVRPPAPEMTPANEVGELLETVKVLPPRLTVVVAEALLKLEIVRAPEAVAIVNVDEPERATPEEVEMSPSPERRNVPAETVVAPV